MNQHELDMLVAAINDAAGDDGEYVKLGLSLWRKKPVVVFAKRAETSFPTYSGVDCIICAAGDMHIVRIYESDETRELVYSDWPCGFEKFVATYSSVSNYWTKNELEKRYIDAGYLPVVKSGTQWMVQIRTSEPDGYLLITTEECAAGEQQRIFDGDYLSVGIDGEMWPIANKDIDKYELV